MLNRLNLNQTKKEHTITLMAEFIKDNQSIKDIAKLSDYISNVSNTATILTDFQSFPAGYRIVYIITYIGKRKTRNHYTKYLAKMSDWLCNDKNIVTISKYHYNHV